MKKYIFTDLDGTVIHKGKIPPKTKECLLKLMENGHDVYICTGRNYSSGHTVLDFNTTGAVVLNGGNIHKMGKTVYDRHFSKEELDYLMPLIKKHNIKKHIETLYRVYSDEGLYEDFIKKIGEDSPNRTFCKRMDEYKNEEIYKIVLGIYPEDKEKYHLFLNELDKDFITCESIPNKDGYFQSEITNKNVSKGNAIKKLDELGIIDINHTIGIGDSLNDFDMLQVCETSIVMGNGDERVKAFATYVTDHIEEDGYYNIFRKLGLINE